jgi:hypothetical protein
MPEISEAPADDGAQSSCINHDLNDPIQKEVSKILKNFQYDIMGVISLGKDGIMRSLTSDRKVLSAEQVKAFLSRFEGTDMEEWNKNLEDADGTKTSKEKWFEPDDDILPPPLSEERWNQVKNGSEESKDKLRQLVRERDK